jgi:sporulation protein YlmC with PRC-barrel domain
MALMAENKTTTRGTGATGDRGTSGDRPMAGKDAPCIKVAVVDSNNLLKCVTVGFDGKVIGTSDWRDHEFATNGQSYGSMGTSTLIVKSADVIGKTVVNERDERLGKIEDLAIDPQQGRVGYAVLSFGGFLGAGDKLFAVPWPVLRPHTADQYVINVSKERLENAPGFAKSAWPDMHDLKWNETLHGYYQQPYYWDDDRRSESTRRPSVYKAKEIVGMKVRNWQDESLGEIEEIVIDPNDGHIRYAVVGVGGLLGIGERYIAVPWTAFDYDTPKKELVIDVSKDRVEKAPGFDKNNWPNFGNEQWGGEVHRYYNQEPYWNSDRSRPSSERATPPSRP